MIIKDITVKQVLDYELYNDINIFDELGYFSFSTAAGIICIAEKCDEETAYKIIEKNIEKMGFEQFFETLAYEVAGRRPDDKNSDGTIKNYNSFSDILEDFYNEIQTVDKNLGLSDFYNMSTRYMYRYADGLKDRYINDLNKNSENNFLLANTFLGMLFGKLKEPLHFDEDGNIHKKAQLEDIKSKLKASGHNTFM